MSSQKAITKKEYKRNKPFGQLELLDLNDDILVKIFRCLKARDLCRLALVSKQAKVHADNNVLWKFAVLADWPLPNPRTKDWKRYYEKRYLLWRQKQMHGQSSAPNTEAIALKFLRSPTYLINSRFRLMERFGKGSFGEIFFGKDTANQDQKVAIKLEPASSRDPQLHYESRVYKALKGSLGIADILWSGSECNYNIMVMQLLGPSLEDLFNTCHRTFSLRTVVLLAQKLIRLVEGLHQKSFIHRDIKPDNFVIGLQGSPQEREVFIIDFGLAKKLSSAHQKPNYVPVRRQNSLTGTPRYASINTHLGYEQSRRDDLESLGYLLVYFYRGSLPWQGLPAKTKKQKYERITEKKVDTSLDQLCSGFPSEFIKYFQHVRQLNFADPPQYDYLVGLFEDLMKQKGYSPNDPYDWSSADKKSKSNNNNNNNNSNAAPNAEKNE